MAINPNTKYPGKIATPDASYPYGGAQNITTPGDGTGTPWEAALVNDMFGMWQRLLSLAGIVPSGSPETAVTSQYFDSMLTLFNDRSTIHNIASDANYTLTGDQNLRNYVAITDTGVVLTAGRSVIVNDLERVLYFSNQTAQILTLKTAAGTGIAVAAGETRMLRCDGTDVLGIDVSIDNVVELVGNQTIAGVKTFGSFPVTPSLAPTTNYQTANKKYVDDNTEATWVANDSRAKTALNASGSAGIYATRAWVNFNGTGTVAINASGNVSSITDNGTGDYTVNFATAMEDADYATTVSASPPASGDNFREALTFGGTYTSSAVQVVATLATNTTTKTDTSRFNVAIHR